MLQDMTSTSEAKRAVQETVEGLGGIDIVIANAVGYLLKGTGEAKMLMSSGMDEVLRMERP